MAGDWIKVENVTPDKPEVFVIAELLGIDADAVLGKLIRIWIWADQQTYAGNDGSVTLALLDSVAGVSGFGQALLAAGWLKQQKRGLVFPNFNRLNGQSAKQRGLTARRVAKTKAKKGNAASVTPALPERYQDFSGASPRERKREREKEKESNKKEREREKREKEREAFAPSQVELPEPLDTPSFRAAWAEWIQHRIEIKAKLTPTSVHRQFLLVAQWGERRAIAAIHHTIAKGWRGIREPDEPRGQPAASTPAPLPVLERPK